MKFTLVAVAVCVLATVQARPTTHDLHELLIHSVDFLGASGNLLDTSGRVLSKAAKLGHGLGAALDTIVGHHGHSHSSDHHSSGFVHSSPEYQEQHHTNYIPIPVQHHHEHIHSSYGPPSF